MTSSWARWCLKPLASRLFTQPLVQAQIRETSKLTGLCERNLLVTGEFSAPKASNADNVSIWDVIMSHLPLNYVEYVFAGHMPLVKIADVISGDLEILKGRWWPSKWKMTYRLQKKHAKFRNFCQNISSVIRVWLNLTGGNLILHGISPFFVYWVSIIQ